MNDSDIQQRFHLLQKEIEATATLLKDTKIDLTATIDSLKLELEIMKTYMERANPGFVEAYPRLKDEIIQAIDPEWLETAKGRKQ